MKKIILEFAQTHRESKHDLKKMKRISMKHLRSKRQCKYKRTKIEKKTPAFLAHKVNSIRMQNNNRNNKSIFVV